VSVGADEPHWIVNFKKSIASQLQLDVTGVRADGVKFDVPTEDFNSAVMTYEVNRQSTIHRLNYSNELINRMA
jgi:Lipoprotein amino terminal region